MKYIPWVWVAVAFVTFATSASDRQQCLGFERKTDCVPSRAMNGLIAGALWPLYWSWAIAEEIRNDPA